MTSIGMCTKFDLIRLSFVGMDKIIATPPGPVRRRSIAYSIDPEMFKEAPECVFPFLMLASAPGNRIIGYLHAQAKAHSSGKRYRIELCYCHPGYGDGSAVTLRHLLIHLETVLRSRMALSIEFYLHGSASNEDLFSQLGYTVHPRLKRWWLKELGPGNTVPACNAVNGPEIQCILDEPLPDDDSIGEIDSLIAAPAAKGKKEKVKSPQVSGPSSPSPSPFNSADSSNEPGSSSSAVQKTLDQLLAIQIEMQKQMVAYLASPAKEGKTLETSLGKRMEKTLNLNNEALWARFQDENAKNDKLGRDHLHQITGVITDCMSKELPVMLDITLEKELASVGQFVARLIASSVEKSISSAITDSFKSGVGDKAVNQLDKSVNSKLEATVARQIQAQFQTSGKQAIQDSLRSCLEATLVPAFEMSCKSMFEQVDAAFQKGMVEHTTAAQQQSDSTHSPLALALRETINSVSSITQTLTGELADGQHKLLALAAAGANSKAVNPLVGLHEMVEVPLDATKELSRLVSERKFEEAFIAALERSDVSIVSWLCSQVDLQGILSASPLPLSQCVLLALLQQLASDINKEMSRKLKWMTEVACAINPADPMIAVHVRLIFEQVYQIMGHHRNLPNTGTAEGNSIRLVMHIINSMLGSCK